MDKNSIIGFVLIAAVLIGFTYFTNQTAEKDSNKRRENIEQLDKSNHSETVQAAQQDTPDSLIGQNNAQNVADSFFGAVNETDTTSVVDSSSNISVGEKIVSLENKRIKIDFTTNGGQIMTAQLKEYKRFNEDSLYVVTNNDAFNLLLRNNKGGVLRTSELNFTPVVVSDKNSLVMRYSVSPSQHVDFIYTLSEDDYMLKFDIALFGLESLISQTANAFELQWNQELRRQEKNRAGEEKYSRLSYKYVGDDVLNLSETKNDSKDVTEAPVKWVAFKGQFFSSILIADNQLEEVQLDSKILTSEDYLKSYSASMYAPTNYDAATKSVRAGFRYYLGPLDYTPLKEYDADISDVNKQLDLDQLVPLGWTLFRWVNQIFVIPVFNLLRSTGMSMGIVILLLTFIVKIITSPLMFKSFKSSAKMRVLRPDVELLNEKYPKQEQAMEKQQAVMALYRSAGANPMSGCIPMLAQMPILIALFQFFPTAIQLRQESFLWANDLSTYDAIFEWGTSIPLIGTHLSLFCILMTVTNIVYTKFNMDMTNTGQQQMPGMKWMMYLMPLIFFFVLNDFPAGLTYYYFLSLLITILLTLAFRFLIDEDKVRAQLEANKVKNKNKKKSGFMARLEEAQRLQQQQKKDRNKKQGKR